MELPQGAVAFGAMSSRPSRRVGLVMSFASAAGLVGDSTRDVPGAVRHSNAVQSSPPMTEIESAMTSDSL